jgi:hypothetical protein
MARAWYYDSDNSVEDNSSTESIASDTDLTEPEDGCMSDADLTDSGADDSDVDLSDTQDEIYLDTNLIESEVENITDAEESGILLDRSLSNIKKHYEDPGDNPTQNLSDIDPDFNKSINTKKQKQRVIDRWHRFVSCLSYFIAL